ncbi:hypothetical protein LIA77_01916 [Sarocladium implicatum]|jgi:hypothetical protein|nr:hypothetical protein LIA77_01916 [Sarocladium implicatum]
MTKRGSACVRTYQSCTEKGTISFEAGGGCLRGEERRYVGSLLETSAGFASAVVDLKNWRGISGMAEAVQGMGLKNRRRVKLHRDR